MKKKSFSFMGMCLMGISLLMASFTFSVMAMEPATIIEDKGAPISDNL